MLLLTSVSDLIQVVTGSAASVDVHTSYVDNNAGTTTPARTNTAAITTATTTTIVASPASSVQRNVKNISLTNNHATTSTQVTVQHTDGTNVSDLIGVTLLAGENLMLNAIGEWRHYDMKGAEYAYSAPAYPNLGITGTLAETMPRELCNEANNAAPTASGTLWLQAIYLTAGQLVSNITISSATTAANLPTNYFFALYDINRTLRAVSANQTTTAWAANTLKTLAMTTAYRVPTSGIYFIGFMMTATAIITTKGIAARTGNNMAALIPILQGASSTALTTAMPDPAAAITASTLSIYAAVT